MEPKKGIYRHFKGKCYQYIGLAKDSETCEPMVIYRALYGDCEFWVRPLSMWNEEVVADGKKVARFTYIGDTM